MGIPITASMLYDLVLCPHRVTMDNFADPTNRDEPNSFVELLWKRGSLYEKNVMESLDFQFTDLSMYTGEEKKQRTLDAVQRGDTLIYSGLIEADGLLGEPDLLRKEGDLFVAGDIKSGAGEEGTEDLSKPKKHYAVQLSLYTDILERKGFSTGRHAFIWDITGKEVIYDLTQPQSKHNKRTLWQEYQDYLTKAREIVEKQTATLAAYSGICKLCHWYSACLKQLNKADDLTLIPELGRSKRDIMMGMLPTVQHLAEAAPDSFFSGSKTVFQGIGTATLEKFHARAKLIKDENARPYLKQPLTLPVTDLELYFDVETDPIHDLCYLHGFIERRGGDNNSERFVSFFIDEPTKDAEKKTFAQAWHYIQGCQPCVIYYYSKYERTIYRKLQEKYPDVCTSAELESLFDTAQAVDLYFDVVLKKTEWPTKDYSIKTLAKYLDFNWRDTHPSGAASIEWFQRWIESRGTEIRQRILDYNEDDCRATRVLRDALSELEARTDETR